MATKDVKRELPRTTGLVLCALFLMDLIFAVLFFFIPGVAEGFLKLFGVKPETIAQVLTFTTIVLCKYFAILCLVKSIGVLLVYLWRKEGFWIYSVTTLVFMITFVVLGVRAGVMSVALVPVIALLIMHVVLFGSLLLRNNGVSVWSRLKMIQWKKNGK